MSMAGTIVEGSKLLEASGASIGGAVVLSVAVSLLIRGAARSAEHRRAGNGAAAAANTAVALAALVVCLGAVVAAIAVMTAK